MARTVLLGEKNQKKIDTMKATNEALDAGISATKPGNTADDVAQNFWATSSAVFPGFVAAIPAFNASLVAFIVSIFF